jgi:hypothetical protein
MAPNDGPRGRARAGVGVQVRRDGEERAEDGEDGGGEGESVLGKSPRKERRSQTVTYTLGRDVRRTLLSWTEREAKLPLNESILRPISRHTHSPIARPKGHVVATDSENVIPHHPWEPLRDVEGDRRPAISACLH